MFGSKFWDGIAEGASKQWMERIFSPALLFWAGGALAYATAHDCRRILAAVAAADLPHQAMLALAGVLLVAASDRVTEDVQPRVLRLMEGYWPRFANGVRRWRVKAMRKRVEGMRARWDALAARYQALTEAEREEYVRLDAELADHPAPERALPTRLGNTLRAAEDYGWRRYGLATGVLWVRLWLAMPKEARDEVGQARERLDTSVRLYIWSTLFLIWSMWAWRWVIPLAAIGILAGYAGALHAAGVFAELLRGSFDLYRVKVYEAVRWPLPLDPSDEYARGKELTDYLWRGSRQETPKFVAPQSK